MTHGSQGPGIGSGTGGCVARDWRASPGFPVWVGTREQGGGGGALQRRGGLHEAVASGGTPKAHGQPRAVVRHSHSATGCIGGPGGG